MPNICSYGMKITGNINNVEELISILDTAYDLNSFPPLHMWRIFDANANIDERYDNDIVEAYIHGSCAWSVSACMLECGYQAEYRDPVYNGTTLERETKRLNLVAEVYSEEPGCGFMEHYIVAFGNIETDETTDYYEYFLEDFETVEDFNNISGADFTQEEFENYDEDFYAVGGFDWYFSNGLYLYLHYKDEKSLVCANKELRIITEDTSFNEDILNSALDAFLNDFKVI